MTDLGENLRQTLSDEAELRPPEVADERVSHDGTIKWLVRVDSGNSVEMVFLPDGDRGTLRVTRVGCALACTFCSTTQQGFNRNLSAAEGIGQVVGQSTCCVLGNRAITNVVMMKPLSPC